MRLLMNDSKRTNRFEVNFILNQLRSTISQLKIEQIVFNDSRKWKILVKTTSNNQLEKKFTSEKDGKKGWQLLSHQPKVVFQNLFTDCHNAGSTNAFGND